MPVYKEPPLHCSMYKVQFTMVCEFYVLFYFALNAVNHGMSFVETFCSTCHSCEAMGESAMAKQNGGRNRTRTYDLHDVNVAR